MLSLSLAALLLTVSAPADGSATEVCVEEQVKCVRAPCPPVRVCRAAAKPGRNRPALPKPRDAH